MAGYRLYSIDGAGKIIEAEWFHARTDDEAVDLARALNKSRTCEVWNRTKFVRSISVADVLHHPRPNA